MTSIQKRGYFWRFLYIFGSLIFILILVLTFIFFQEYQRGIEMAKLEQRNILARQENTVSSALKSTVSDIVFLSKLNELKNFIDKREANYESLCREIQSFSQSRGLYDQIRILDLLGNELVRVNYQDEEAVIVPKSQLQNKIDRYYFKYGRMLMKNQIYISPLDLNIEHDKIEVPYKPMLRFCYPLYLEGQSMSYILVVNYKVQPLLDEIKNALHSSRFSTFVLNKNGYYLLGPTPGDEWGFMFPEKKDISFSHSNPKVWNDLQQKPEMVLPDKQGIFASKLILNTQFVNLNRAPFISIYQTSESCSQLYLLSFFSKKNLFESILFPLLVKYALIFFVLGAVIFLFAYLISRAWIEKDLANQKIKMQYSFVNALIEAIPNPIYFVDYENDEFGCNKGFESLTGKAKSDLLSMKIEKLFNTSALHKKLVSGEEASGGTKSNEIRLKYPDGVIHSLIFHKAPVNMLQKKIGIVGVFNDVTEIREAEKALKESEKKLQITNQTKDKFFSILAHDLKNSFHSILGFSEVINEHLETMSQKDMKRNVDAIYSTANSTFHLLINLLDWANLQEGKLTLKLVNFNLKTLANECIDLFESLAKEKAIEVVLDIEETIELMADREMIFTVFRNILVNAFKYTQPGGKIEILCNLKEDAFTIFINDTGPGIEEEILNKLFKLDVRPTGRKNYNDYGTGIGLVLCQEFIHLHGGEIGVSSKIGIGSSFFFSLPRA